METLPCDLHYLHPIVDASDSPISSSHSSKQATEAVSSYPASCFLPSEYEQETTLRYPTSGFLPSEYGWIAASDLQEGPTTLQVTPSQDSHCNIAHHGKLYPQESSTSEQPFFPTFTSQPASDSPLTSKTNPLPAVATPAETRWQCTHCTKSFRREANLTRHNNNFHGINRGLHLCPILGCVKSQGQGYSRADKVTEHLWKKHADLGFRKDKVEQIQGSSLNSSYSKDPGSAILPEPHQTAKSTKAIEENVSPAFPVEFSLPLLPKLSGTNASESSKTMLNPTNSEQKSTQSSPGISSHSEDDFDETDWEETDTEDCEHPKLIVPGGDFFGERTRIIESILSPIKHELVESYVVDFAAVLERCKSRNWKRRTHVSVVEAKYMDGAKFLGVAQPAEPESQDSDLAKEGNKPFAEADCLSANENIQHCTGQSRDSTSASALTLGAQARTSTNGPSQKRSAGGEGDQLPDDDNERSRKRPRGVPSSSLENLDDSSMFACPYRKHNPRRYCVRNWRSCALTPLKTVARVKFVLILLINYFQS
jgi:hypothetical protein